MNWFVFINTNQSFFNLNLSFMNIAQISDNLEKLVESFNKDSFIFDLLLAYGTPKATISRLRQGDVAMFSGETVIIKKKLFFKSVVDEDLQTVIDNLKTNEKVIKQAPRFIVVTDFETLLAYDTKTDESLDIPILEIPQHNDFFLPWAGMEKSKQQTENIADVRAAERMAKLYDEIKKDNHTTTHEEVHNLNVFLSRLLFCYFAEDTDIFEKDLFTKSVDSHTQKDGSDLNVYLDTLFEVMNTSIDARRASLTELPAYLKAFPYVNGGLFRNPHTAPTFTRKSRQMLIDCGLSLQWQDINPDIFGSMIQAVITPEHRGGLGMHYTSVPNIMKVIEPLFLDELKEEFARAVETRSIASQKKLLQRIWKIKIFDPACGSGNFLIIAYKELRKLEMDIFNQMGTFAFSNVSLNNFYGIELDDFAHEVATLSLWLAEHQMNQIFRERFGDAKPALPLQETGNIVNGNACRIDWETVCPKNEGDEIYILGNPPYLGSSMQSTEQKDDMAFVFKGIDGYKNLDYIACWFLKGAIYILNCNAQFAFVSTNSICQGEQVALLWKHILNKSLVIGFAHTSFKWSNNARANAGVTVVIIGLRNTSNKAEKFLFIENRKILAKRINAYLTDGNDIFFYRRNDSISKLPLMLMGNKLTDGGNLILNLSEKNELESSIFNSSRFIKKLIGSDEFINGHDRWCLWINDEELDKALMNPLIKKKIENVGNFRSQSKALSTRCFSGGNHKFIQIQHEPDFAIAIPEVSSEKRTYIPIGFCNNDTVLTNKLFAVYNPELYLMSILTSMMHMVWTQTICGRLETRISYSSVIGYNNFPFPIISDKQKKELEQHVYNILAEREKHSEKTLAQLYDPDKMPDGLREAHRQNDLAVERCYRSRPFESDEERLEYLFKLYEQMIEEEKEKGTLFGKNNPKPLKGLKK